MSQNYVWKKCDECGRKVKRFRIWKKKLFLCYFCYFKKGNKIPNYKPQDLKEELNKVREMTYSHTLKGGVSKEK
jgi:hypothetical protein